MVKSVPRGRRPSRGAFLVSLALHSNLSVARDTRHVAIFPCHHPCVWRAPYTNAKGADESAIELMSARLCLCPANRRSSVNPQRNEENGAYKIKNNRGFYQGQGGKGHRVSIFNETPMVLALVALPGSTLFSRTRAGLAVGGFLEAKVDRWKADKLKTFDRNDTVAFQVPPGGCCPVEQWGGVQDMIVLVATIEKRGLAGRSLSVWAKIRCNVGATVFLYGGLFHHDMHPLFGRHLLDDDTKAAHVIVDAVLPR